MDEISLKYGGHELSLKKSDTLIAVKPHPGTSQGALASLSPHLGDAALSLLASEQNTLGGFHIVNVADGPQPLEETLDALRAEPEINTGSHVFYTADDAVPFVPTGQIYIEFATDAAPEARQALLDEYKLQVVEARDERSLIVQATPQSPNPLKTAKALQESGLVAVAEPDLATPGKIQGFVLPTDPRFLDQWHLHNKGLHRNTSIGFLPGADARVMAAWEEQETLGSPNVVVAVIDDGFDLTHPDLSGDWKLVAPKDFTRNSNSPLPDVLQEDWHGTACAGVAVGNADGTGIVGAAPHCRLMPIRWGGSLSDREIENWFGYVRQQGAWVVSCSWSASARFFVLSTRASRAIERCATQGRDGLGCVICFAAGNENRNINDPAAESVNGFAIHPNVIAVSASTSRDARSHYSNYGAEISVCAPSSGAGGWGITTSDVMGQYSRGGQTFEAGYSPGAYTDDFGGTSSACPLVAGVCALLLSVRPALRAEEVKKLIQQTARRIGPADSYNANGHSLQFGYGCVNAKAALETALSLEEDAFEAGFGEGYADKATDKAYEGDIARQWGEQGHHIVNVIAINALPDPLLEFYRTHESFMRQHAMDADNAKSHDPDERPRHFIDIDLYGEPPFSELPEDRTAAEKKFGATTILKRGILPWQIEETFNALVAAWVQADGDNVLRHSAWLGHYVGDAHVPLHTTENHNGQLTGQKGLHSYFETRLLQRFVEPEQIKPRPASLITGAPHAEAFRWVRESHSFVALILEADAANGGKSGRRNLKGFAQTAQPIAIQCLSNGCSRLASLWLSAWDTAGNPNPNTLAQ
jgi:subtilisin family serine protease